MTASRRRLILLLALAGTIISICIGLRQSMGLYMQPIMADFGITATAFGFTIALQNIVWGISQPFVGAIADKYGARPVLVATSLLYALGLSMIVFAKDIPGGITLAGIVIGVGVAGTGFGVLIGTVSRATPPEKRSQTVGLVSALGSLGTMVLAPLGQSMIDHWGWKSAMLGFAAIAASMALLSLPIREHAQSDPKATKPRANVREAVREALGHRGYMFMAVAFFACGFQLVFIATHLPQYLQVCGVDPSVGGTALGLIGLFNAIGTYGFGLLGARYSQKHLLAMIYLLRTLFICIFLAVPISPTSTLVFAAAMGLLWLGVAPLVTGIIGRVFGLTHFNTLYGIVFFSHQVGSFLGAWMGGLVFDRFHNYNVAWGALIAIGITAFLLQWLMEEKPPAERDKIAPLPAPA